MKKSLKKFEFEIIGKCVKIENVEGKEIHYIKLDEINFVGYDYELNEFTISMENNNKFRYENIENDLTEIEKLINLI
jgi:hypothetical protein